MRLCGERAKACREAEKITWKHLFSSVKKKKKNN